MKQMEILSMQQKENLSYIINNFLFYIKNKEYAKLKDQFFLDKVVCDEIIEELTYHDIFFKELTLAPKNILLTTENVNRAIFDIFEMNEPNEYGVEACIYANNKETDLTIIGTFSFKNGNIEFLFKSIRY